MQDEYGETALHTASSKGHIDVARYLLEKGATVNILNKVRQLDACPWQGFPRTKSKPGAQ